MNVRWIAIVLAVGLLGCSGPKGNESGDSGSAQAPAAQPAESGVAEAQTPPAAQAASAAVDKDKIGEAIKRYYTRSGQIPDDVKMVVTELKKSSIDGLDEGTLELSRGQQSQKMQFLISNDGRWFLRADPVDLTVDPIEEVLKKIKVGPNDPSRGPKDAKVTIVEFSDFQCPFCARAEQILEGDVLKAYGDKVLFVYKQFPLKQIHPWAEPASLIGMCVFKQGGNDQYWKYHEALFKAQKDIKPDTAADQLVKIAQEAGADPAKVKSCFDAKETQAMVDTTLAEAEALDVNSTPTFFVNGHKLSGAQPLEAFKAVIEPELNPGAKQG